MRLVVVSGVSEIAALAHQFTAQIRVRSKAVATVQPEQVVNQQEFANGNGYRKNAFAGFNEGLKLAQPHAFFEVFRLDELVDIAHHRATLLINVEHRMENIFADVFAWRRGKAHRATRQRVAEIVVEMFPVVEMQQQRIYLACSARRFSSSAHSR